MRAVQWKVGQPVPKLLPQEEILVLEADGKELKHILKRFTNRTILKAPKEVADPSSISVDTLTIPVAQGKLVKWAGDFAKTIFLNL
jgi:hypothetical protein